MEVDKEEVLADLNAKGKDTSQWKQFFSLIKQLVSFWGQTLNSTLYSRRKSILETSLDGKRKLKRDFKGTVRSIKPYWQQSFAWVTFWKRIL